MKQSESEESLDPKEQWKNILDKDILKDSITAVALYITVFELLEDTVKRRPKDFYTVLEFDEEAKKHYEDSVLSLYNKKAIPGINPSSKELISSLLWFKNCGAIDDNDINNFVDSRTLRNKVTHEMLTIITEGGKQLIKQFALMYALFCKIEKWWILEIELPISGQFTDLTEEEQQGVMSGNMVLIQTIMDILANDSNIHYKEICEELGVPVK